MDYLAAPYSTGLDPRLSEKDRAEVVFNRFYQITQAAAYLTERGHFVYSPVTHCAAIASHAPMDHAFWMRHCMTMLRNCSTLYLLTLPGWDSSDGVADEIAETKGRGKLIFLLRPGNWTVARLDQYERGEVTL